MSGDLVREARDLLAGVAPGPWFCNPGSPTVFGRLEDSPKPLAVTCGGGYPTSVYPNARFIALAREMVPALAAEVEALSDDLARLQAERDALAATVDRVRGLADRWCASGDYPWGNSLRRALAGGEGQ